jgi:mannose-1-phosphate guanylyltransferase
MSILPHRYHEDRPWGSFDQFTLNEPSTVKIVRVAAGKRLSLQRHAKRSEFWRVIEGAGTATIGSEERPVAMGDELEIPVGTLHRLQGGPEGVAVLEISTGEFDESDIERVEDDFGRAGDHA